MADLPQRSNFGWMSAPPRSLQSPGVAGLLQAESQVFFLTLFDSRSMGRVSDLLAVRLARAGIAESRMREAIAILAGAVGRLPPDSGASLEIGLDPDALAIGLSWSPGAGMLGELFSDGEPRSWLDGLARRLRRSSDGLVLKTRAENSAVELVVLIRHSGEGSQTEDCEFVVTSIDPDVKDRPAVAFYEVIAGDAEVDSGGVEARGPRDRGTDRASKVTGIRIEAEAVVVGSSTRPGGESTSFFPAAAKNDEESGLGEPAGVSGQDAVFKEKPFDPASIEAEVFPSAGKESGAAAGASGGEGGQVSVDQITLLKKKLDALEREKEVWKSRALAGGATTESEKVRVRGRAEAVSDETETVVAGRDLSDSDSERIIGAADALASPQAPIRAGKGEAAQEEVIKIHGASGSDSQDPRRVSGRASVKGSSWNVATPSDGAAEVGFDDSKTVVKGRPAGAPNNETTLVGGGSFEDGDSDKSIVKAGDGNSIKKKKAKGFFGRLFSRDSDDSVESESAVTASSAQRIPGGAEGGGRPSAGGVTIDAGEARGKRVAEGMMTEVMAEKARLAEAQREMELQFKQKELDFRRRLDTAAREIKDREDEIRNRDAQITKLKEQAGNAIKAAERMKGEAETASLEAGFRQRYQTAERVVQTLRSDNLKLERQLEEVKAQQASAAATAKLKEREAVEAQSLREQAARLQKQVDELRRQNQQVQEKASRHAGPSSTAVVEELRRKMDASVRVAANHRKEAEAIRGKMELLRKEEARLRLEVGRLQAELKKRGGGASSGPANPAVAPKTPVTPTKKAA